VRADGAVLLKLGAFAMVTALGVYWSYTHGGYFNNLNFLGGLLFLEILLAALSHYTRAFIVVLVGAFLWASLDIPLQNTFAMIRWIVLAAGAFVGYIVWMKTARKHFTLFHLMALFAVLTAAVSASASSYPQISLLKALSLALLFLYGSAGARVAVVDRERIFFKRLVLACEIFVYVLVICYFVLDMAVMGNPNSLGAITGVVIFPILLWSILAAETRTLRRRGAFALLLCTYLLYTSLARAGMAAALVSTFVLCLCLGQIRLLSRALMVVVLLIGVAGVIAPAKLQNSASELVDAVLYKRHQQAGVLGSRQTPWTKTISVIREHPVVGGGYGVSLSGEASSPEVSKYSTGAGTDREQGSAYLAILEWVGIVGVVPFAGLVLLVFAQVWRTCAWMVATRNPNNYAVPLAMIMLGGLIHAAFEDWLFAVGSYLCVLFWIFGFILVDLAPVMRSGQIQQMAPRPVLPVNVRLPGTAPLA
jgi:O-Antigen ligase